MIKISHLKKSFAGSTPLQDVNATINDGEIISIIGPSGTGKSTFLRCINMLEKPTEGTIEINGVDITNSSCNIYEIRKKMGMVFQSFNLFSHMRVIDNIAYGPRKLLKMSKQEAYEKARELLKTVSLSNKAYAYPDELSGGQKQRIAIARALAMDPDIILFDEPTSALDPTIAGEVLSVIRRLAKNGMTMILVTHEMEFAKEISTRIFYMDDGIIYEEGSPKQIFNNPKKDKTRRFIKKLNVFERTLKKNVSDFIAFTNDLEIFGKNHLMEADSINCVRSIFEELCYETILKEFQSVDFTLEYSETTQEGKVTIVYGEQENNCLNNMDIYAKAIIKNLCPEITHSFSDGKNLITVQLKNYKE